MTDLHASPAATPPDSRRTRTTALVVGVVLVAFVALLATRSNDQEVRREIIGKSVPAVAGTSLAGDRVDVDTWLGSWVVVNFFATWCVECVQEHPELIEFAERHDDGRARVVSVAFDNAPDDIRAFFAERGGEWPVLADGVASVPLDFGVVAVPETYLVSPTGQVVAVFISGVTADQLDRAIEAAGGIDAAVPVAGGLGGGS